MAHSEKTTPTGQEAMSAQCDPVKEAAPVEGEPVRRHIFASFLSAEAAAVTVEFVVLTATVLTIGLSVATMIGDGAMTEADDINKCMRRAGNQLSKDIPYEKQLRRMRRRCAKL